MGNHSSSHVSAVLSVMAATIVNSQQSCLATAQSSVAINILGADNVFIKRLQIHQESSANTSCEFGFNASISMDSVIASVEQMLDKLIVQQKLHSSGFFDTSETHTKVSNKLATSISQNMISSCMAEAVNSFRIKIQRTAHNVTLHDLDISSIAIATVTQCLMSQNVSDGSNKVPLSEYIEQNFKNGTISIRPGINIGPRIQKKTEQIMLAAAGGTAVLATIAAFVIEFAIK